MSKPGIGGKSFTIKFTGDWFNKGDILNVERGIKLEVIKTYKFTWWKKILLWFGFKVKFYEVKVIEKQ